MKGAKLKAELIVVLSSGAEAVTCTRNRLTLGSGDPGPVHRATTITSTAKGIQASSTSLVPSPWLEPVVCAARSSGLPP